MKSDQHPHCSRRKNWAYWLIGLGSLGWLLLRSGTNPRRLIYPCQQAALASSSGFLGYLASLLGLGHFYRFLKQKSALVGGGLFVLALLLISTLAGSNTPTSLASVNVPLPGWTHPNAISNVYAMGNVPTPECSLDGGTLPATGDCSDPNYALHDVGVDSLIEEMNTQGDHFFESTTHPTGTVGANDVVVIKINNQWAENGGGRLCTNTDVLKGLIWRILQHPDGFSGEIVVAENTQGVVWDWDHTPANSQDPNQSYQDVINVFQSLGYPVSLYRWDDLNDSRISGGDVGGGGYPTGEYAHGNNADAYILLEDADGTGTDELSYPKFQTDGGTYVSTRYGVWNGSSYEADRLTLINVPVLKQHGMAGATIAWKNLIGFVTTYDENNRYGNWDVMHDFYWGYTGGTNQNYGLLGRQMAFIRAPDLNVVDAIWVADDNYDGTSIQQNILLASRDPFAVDWYASEYVLYALYANQDASAARSGIFRNATRTNQNAAASEWSGSYPYVDLLDGYDGSVPSDDEKNQMNVYVVSDEPGCEAISDASINGPDYGYTDTPVAFTASVIPPSATLPITYTWLPTPDAGYGAVVTYTWPTAGEKTITITTENCGGSGTAVHTITILPSIPGCPFPLLDVTIDGFSGGYTNTLYTFEAIATSTGGDPTPPITYTWTPTPVGATILPGQAIVSYTWATTGTKIITVTAENCGGGSSDVATHTIVIRARGQYNVYLPLILRNDGSSPPSGPPVSTTSQSAVTPDRQRKTRGAAAISQSSAFCPPLDPPSGTVITVTTVAQLQSAVNSASSSTTILVADGTYNLDGVYLRFDVPNVTLRSVSGNRENVVLDGNYVTTEIAQIVASNVIIADLTLREAYDHPIHVMSSESSDTLNTLIYNVHIIDPGQQAIKINPYTGENALYFPDSGTIACSRIELTDTGRPHIRDDCYTGGVDAHQARDWVIRDNFIEGFWCTSGLSEHGIHMWRSCRDTLVERNELRNNARGIGFGLVTSGIGIRTYPDNPCPGAEGGYVDHYGGIIRNNFVFADDAGLFDSEYGFDCGVCLWQACGAQAVHNTVASMQAPFSSIEWNLPLTDVDVINNLVTHNLRDRDGTAYLAGNLENQLLSLFADGSNGDLHLVEEATAAIDQGVALTAGLCDDDIDGDARPSGSAPDVGADEYRVQLPTLNLIAPTGSTLWPMSSTRQIRWTTSGSGSVPEINLTYSTDGFVTSQTIAASLTNTGVYTWVTPPTPTTSAQVRIASTVSPTVISDTSGAFTLYDPSTLTNTICLPLVLRNYTPPPPPCTTPLTNVTISGPTSGSLVLHTFTGIVAPSDATGPITYDWSPVPANGQGTATASYQWSTPGTYTVTLVATNCGGTADDVHTITIQSQASGELVQPSDLTYLGAFRLPGGEDPPLTFAYGGNAMTFNPDGDPGNSDAYPGSLFITGHDRLAYGGLPDGSQVAEVSIPVPTIAISPTDLSQAAFIQTFHDVTAGYFTNLEEIPKLGMQYLNHPDTGPLIHLGWGQHLQPPDEPSHAWFSSTLAAPNLQGVWFIGHQNLYSTNGYMFDIPTAWADAHTQGRYLATGRMRDGGQGGMGPTLFAYRPWLAGGTPPISGTHISETVLLLYENAYNTEEITRCMTGYQHPDEWEGGAWITTPSGKSAVLFAGTKSNGTKYWYGYIHPTNPLSPCVDADVIDFTTCRLADGSSCPPEDFDGCCDEGAGTCASNRGWWTTRFDAQLILYDPNDLAQVAAGEMEPWEPQPYATVDIDEHLYLDPPVWDEIELGWDDQRRARLRAAAYDHENGLLYVLELYADEAKPVVHVWGID